MGVRGEGWGVRGGGGGEFNWGEFKCDPPREKRAYGFHPK